MRFFKSLAAAAVLAKTVSGLPSVTRAGRYLYSNGSRFFIKGVAYQQQGDVTTNDPTGFPEPTNYIDPLTDTASCTRDLPYFKQLGINAIRVYSVNSALPHDGCMQLLSGAGIYVILDLALPVNGSINRVAPSWTVNLLDSYLGTIDAFLKYDNVLAFNIGNEIFTAPSDTAAGPYVKAAARDIKAYLASKSSSILVSFSSTDGDASWLLPSADYLACDTAADSIDLYGLNNYRWCGAATVDVYASLISGFQNYPIPAYFSEFGCITALPRLWTEVAAIYGDATVYNEWSGGVAFSYFAAAGGPYGMVNISSDGKTVTPSNDFTLLQQQFTQATIPNTPAQSAAGANTQATCPPISASWLGSTTLPPTPVDGVCQCLRQNYVTCEFSNGNSANVSPILGDILNYACPQLGTLGGSCAAIGSNGTAGTYGPFSVCDPITQTSYAMSQFYQLSGRQQTSCDFAGNGTVVSTGPASETAADTAASACASQAFVGTTVPAAPAATAANTLGAGTTGAEPTSGAGSSGSGSSGSGSKNGASGGLDRLQGSLAMGGAALVAVLGGVAVLL